MGTSATNNNAEIKTLNESKKISHSGDALKTTTHCIIGTTLVDMSIDSCLRVLTWKRSIPPIGTKFICEIDSG